MESSSKSGYKKTVAYDGFGDYMMEKKRKLEHQYKNDQKESDIFKDLVFHVNGHTDPPITELIELIHSHGGKYSQYLTSEVTHMIANNLPTVKIKRLRDNDLVIRPLWILDCIKASKLIDCTPYRMYHKVQTNGLPVNAGRVETTDPEFLSKYFKSSRLHYLSTWKQELIKLTAEFFKEKTKKPLFRDSRVLFHIDLDCFFVSVSLIDKPELCNRPVGVSHSGKGNQESINSSSDLASCNYMARSFGIRNGMSLGKALKLCPELIVLPYDFERYQKVSKEFYHIVFNYAEDIQAVSCDEVFIDVTEKCFNSSPVEIAEKLRHEIFEKCKCTASVGIAHNMLLARLATRKAKPNGVFQVSPDHVDSFLRDIPIGDLPQVGWSHKETFKSMNVSTCGQLMEISQAVLQKEFGGKTGEMFYNFARGIDNRSLKSESSRKSVGAEVNWGVRCSTNEAVNQFLANLAQEVSERLKNAGMKGSLVSLKVKRRKAGAQEPAKFLGCGICDDFSRSKKLIMETNDEKSIFGIVTELYKPLSIPPEELRGAGIHVSKLVDAFKEGWGLTFNFTLGNQKTLNFSLKEKQINNPPELFEILSSSSDENNDDDQVEFIALKASPIKKKAVAFQNLSPGGVPSFKPIRTLSQHWKPRKLFSDQLIVDLSSPPPILISSSPPITIQHSFSLPDLNGLTSIEQIRILLREWISNYEEKPLEIDITTFFTYCRELCKCRVIDRLVLILRFLKRHTENRNIVWKTIYSNLECQCKEWVKEEYGSELIM